MKLTPFARLRRSSEGTRPSKILGELLSSSSVKNHCFLLVAGDGGSGDARAGDGALRCDEGRGGDVRNDITGGEGTAGGTSRRRVGERFDRSGGS